MSVPALHLHLSSGGLIGRKMRAFWPPHPQPPVPHPLRLRQPLRPSLAPPSPCALLVSSSRTESQAESTPADRMSAVLCVAALLAFISAQTAAAGAIGAFILPALLEILFHPDSFCA